MHLIISWLAIAFGFWAASVILPGLTVRGGVGSHLVLAAVFGTLMFLLGPPLYAIIGIGTLGIGFLFSFVTRLIVATVLLKVTDAITGRLSVSSWGTAFLGALVMALTAGVAEEGLRWLVRQ